MTDLDLDAVKARADAATKGPWHKEHDEFGCVEQGDYGWVCGGPNWPAYDEDSEQGHADAEFIAHARTDVPALVAEVERLTLEQHTDLVPKVLYEHIKAERDCYRKALERIFCGTRPAGEASASSIEIAALALHGQEVGGSVPFESAPAEPCGSCDGARWVDDENWQPQDWEWVRGRVPGSGRIPCGICNHGGWNEPDGRAPADTTTEEINNV